MTLTLMVSYNAAKFNGHRHCGSGDIMALVGHAMFQDHVIKMLDKFMGVGSSWCFITLPSLVTI